MKTTTDQWRYLHEGRDDHPNNALRNSSAPEAKGNELRTHLFIQHAPYADLTSMRASQEPDKHQQQEYRVGHRNSDGANYAAMRVQGKAHLEDRVILRSDLLFQARGQSAGNSNSDTPH